MSRFRLKQVVFFGLMSALLACTGGQRDLASADSSKASTWAESDYRVVYGADESQRDLAAQWKGDAPSPDSTEEYLKYLSVLDASGRKKEAEAKLKAYLVSHPEEKRAVFLMAIHYLRDGKPDMAEHFFTKLEKDDDFVWKSLLFNNLGMMALKDNKREVALDYFEKATRESPRIAAPLVNLGSMLLAARNFSKAEDLFSRALQIDPGFEDAMVGLGGSLEGQGEFQKAGTMYNKFIGENPRALSVLYNYSVLLGNRLNQRAEATALMQRYLKGGGRESAKAQKILQSWR